ncbi:MAG TPA: winged helix-turn-helix domain-containing protein [Pyrinomonadaceae bacterium]|nr:winged helix-turn-helix domain-containing protein [Pyrinomonadaceae bacterium]
MPHNNTAYYEFGPYRLELAQRLLTCTGEMVALTRKATEILIVLVAHAGQLVERDELLKEVWPDSFVEESNLTQTIFQLRRTLGDERAEPRYIETVARRGYRFIANVRAVHGNEAQDVAESGNGHGADGGADAVQTVAILPFVNATGDSGYEYLAEGLTDNVVNSLSRVSKLRVMSRSAVFRYKSKRLDPRVIGMELGVGVVLVGSIVSRMATSGSSKRSVPPPIAIVIELVEVRSGWQIWGESFDCNIKEILEVQDAITRGLLSALKLKLTGEEEKRVTTRYTENAEAYQAYLEGRYHWSKYTRSGIEKAIVHFRQAIELDPNYALAYAGIIDCYLRLATNYLPPESDAKGPSVNGASTEENRLDSVDDPKTNSEQTPNSEEKVKLRFEWDWTVAETERRRAIELKTEYPAAHQWFAAYRVATRIFEEVNGRSPTTTLLGLKLPAQVRFGVLTPGEEVHVLCTVAREQIAVGNFEAAALILKSWYPENGWPELQALSPYSAADLLLTLGNLIAYLAGSKRGGNHKQAEVFLSGAIALFEQLGVKSRSTEAQVELARSYYRQGLFDLARTTFSLAISQCPQNQPEVKSHCLIFWSVLERDVGRLLDSMARLREAESLQVTGLLMRGRCELELATTIKELAVSENQDWYYDQARLHYKTALHEFEAIGHHRMAAIVENNLGYLLVNLGLTEESETHLLRSRRFFDTLSDNLRVAQVNETLTRLYIATKRYTEAQKTIECAVQALEQTEGEAVLSEALTTSGIVACRLGRYTEAQKTFEAAFKVSERCGDREGARRALVSMFEEMRKRLDGEELRQLSNKLRRLQSVDEPSLLTRRVDETIGCIKSLLGT